MISRPNKKAIPEENEALNEVFRRRMKLWMRILHRWIFVICRFVLCMCWSGIIFIWKKLRKVETYEGLQSTTNDEKENLESSNNRGTMRWNSDEGSQRQFPMIQETSSLANWSNFLGKTRRQQMSVGGRNPPGGSRISRIECDDEEEEKSERQGESDEEESDEEESDEEESDKEEGRHQKLPIFQTFKSSRVHHPMPAVCPSRKAAARETLNISKLLVSSPTVSSAQPFTTRSHLRRSFLSCTRSVNSAKDGPSGPLDKSFQFNVRSQKPVRSVDPIPGFSPTKSDKVPVICLSNIWKHCKLEDLCPDMHYYLPYRWQICKGTNWEDVPNMEKVEKFYCDPKVDRVPLIDFLTMRSGRLRVRRLSTVSSVLKPSDYVLTTEWLWYWRDERGTWTQYGHSNIKNVKVTVSPSVLENVYLACPTSVIPFIVDGHLYELNFREMKQKNTRYTTERDVRRRPKFLSFADVKLLKGSTKSAAAKSPVKSGISPMNPDIYPKTWDPESMPDIGCKKVLVSLTSIEFSEIVSSFSKTVSGHKVKTMWRLQNQSLWQVFQWQKEQMKKVNEGQDVKEIRLFHGTEREHINAICNQNFDWRICGTHGTLYGKGSYFARDASYSHKYSTPTSSGTRAMFVSRVLVGDYVKGHPQMNRPPLRPGSTTRYYDSCVDNTISPSIFVVFEKHQIYPEYLLEYKDKKKRILKGQM